MMTKHEFGIIRSNIALLYKQRDDCIRRLEELKEYNGLTLKRNTPDKGGHVYYYVKDKSTGIFHYLGNENHPVVQAIKEVNYIKEQLRRIDSNIDVMKKMYTGYEPITYNAVNAALPQVYRNAKLGDNAERELKISAWKAEMAKIKSSYPLKNPEQLTQAYVDGTMMRSKSELNDAFCLDFYRLPYMYEVPIEIDGFVIYPDFRILSPVDLETEFLLEQFGRMDLEDYQESVGWKISKYIKKGFMPNINFFMCFDDLDGNADLRPLHEIILKISGVSENKELLIT